MYMASKELKLKECSHTLCVCLILAVEFRVKPEKSVKAELCTSLLNYEV